MLVPYSTGIQQLHGKWIFSKIDLIRAYDQIPIATPFGLFEAVNTMFGFGNAAQTCQRFVDEITHGSDYVYAYINDLLVASEDEKQHREHLRTLFNRLNDYSVAINLAKCELGAREIIFFGYTVDVDGIKQLAERVDAIIKVPKSATVKHLRRYFGMINFYRHSIPEAANILHPLNDMLKIVKKSNAHMTSIRIGERWLPRVKPRPRWCHVGNTKNYEIDRSPVICLRRSSNVSQIR